MKSRNNRYGCKYCFDDKPCEDGLSCNGICDDCAHFLMVENLRGLKDPGSMWYKHWLITHRINPGGRPIISRPPPNWTPRK